MGVRENPMISSCVGLAESQLRRDAGDRVDRERRCDRGARAHNATDTPLTQYSRAWRNEVFRPT
jgi:hypothetical protein